MLWAIEYIWFTQNVSSQTKVKEIMTVGQDLHSTPNIVRIASEFPKVVTKTATACPKHHFTRPSHTSRGREPLFFLLIMITLSLVMTSVLAPIVIDGDITTVDNFIVVDDDVMTLIAGVVPITQYPDRHLCTLFTRFLDARTATDALAFPIEGDEVDAIAWGDAFMQEASCLEQLREYAQTFL